MAEHSSAGPPASESEQPDLSSDREFLASKGSHNFEDAGYMKFGPEFAPFAEDNINPSYYEYIRRNKDGLIELDIKKLERQVSSLKLDDTSNPSQKESDVPLLSEVLKNFKKLDEDETSAKQIESEKGSSIEELETEELTPYNYERKNKLLDRKPHLREIAIEFLLRKKVSFTEEDLESLINHIELNLNHAISTLRRIAYPKLCQKHFSSEFPSGAFAEEDEPSVPSVDHFEFLHEELPINFLMLFESEDFQSGVIKWEIDPEINNMVPSFIKFLKENNAFQYRENCFTLILAILKNPYRKIEVFYDSESPVVKEQMAIAKYLVKCLGTSNIPDDIFEKLAEAIIKFANIHPSFLASILTGFNDILSREIDNTPAYQIYCKVVNLMTSIGATIIDACLPQHFEKLSLLATIDRNRELYFHLLRACEISIENTIAYESQVKSESSDEIDFSLFYTACYNYFGHDLTTRLIPVFKKYEKRKDREEQYLSKTHAIYPTKDGYMNTELRFLIKNKNRAESESLNFPTVKECYISDKNISENNIYEGKYLFSSQLGYVIQEDINKLSDDDDRCYLNDIKEFSLLMSKK